MENNDTAPPNGTSSVDKSDEALSQIEAARLRAEAAAIAAETSRSKADSESGFAFNAKTNAEEHARTIAQIKGSVEADVAYIRTQKSTSEEAASAATRAKAAAEGDVQAIAKHLVTAQQEASGAGTRRESAEKSSVAAAKSQEEAEAARSTASDAAAGATQFKATAESSALAIQNLQAQVSERAAKTETDAATVATNESASKTIVASMSTAADKAQQTLASVVTYETQLKALSAQFEELRGKIEALLPGTTSAGLSSAFREHKARFDKPQKNWLLTFVVTVGLLLLAGLAGLPEFFPQPSSGGPASWDTILRHIVNRLPIVAPLVWLGIYSGRNYMLALRMQDEYAFKEVISATFEGYKREMAAIAGSDGASPLLKLCDNVLGTLAERPGRIYEGQHDDITPLAPVTKTVAEVAAKITSGLGDAAVKAIEKMKAGGTP